MPAGPFLGGLFFGLARHPCRDANPISLPVGECPVTSAPMRWRMSGRQKQRLGDADIVSGKSFPSQRNGASIAFTSA
jgi:hypothetical protein